MHSYENVPLGAGGSQRLGGADQTGVRVGPNSLSQVWRGDENHRLHLPAGRQVERHQTEVIQKILRHCGLWEEQAARAPPLAKVSVAG